MNKKNIMKKIMISIFLFIISFFSCSQITAFEQKDYSGFNFDDLYENNRDYWNQACGDEECSKEYLKTQRKFYNRLYGILSTYQKKGLYIDDRVILETILFELTPGQSVEDYTEFSEAWNTDKEGYVFDSTSSYGTGINENTPADGIISDSGTDLARNDVVYEKSEEETTVNVNSDDEDPDLEDGEDDYSDELTGTGEEAEEFEDLFNYYAQEIDTLKTLINNALSIDAHCYTYLRTAKGNFGRPISKLKFNSETKKFDIHVETYCKGPDGKKSEEYQPLKIAPFLKKCVKVEEDASATHAYYKYHLNRLNMISKYFNPIFSIENNLVILGDQYEPVEYNLCMSKKNATQKAVFTYYGSEFKVNYNTYWSFLADTSYFDGKKQLLFYYEPVFEKIAREKDTKVECMKRDQCNNSLEDYPDLYDEYNEDIVEVRENIIYKIMGLLENYLKDFYTEEELEEILNYKNYGKGNLKKIDVTEAVRKSFFWPIGSDETEERGGRTFADGEPASTTVVSNFGRRVNEATGETENHTGIDIEGIDGQTNVIAVYDGEVYSVVDNCTVGDYTCNNGMGNEIIIAHPNGDYTVYGHLSQIFVTVGQSVKKGELIAKVGQTGATLKPVLHYEIRKGGASPNDAINPIQNTDPSNPRPAPSFNTASKNGVCEALKGMGYSDKAIAGIMTNVQYESGFSSNNVQNKYSSTQKNIEDDLNYTAGVDSGTISRETFAHDARGYGLIQWTYFTRKERLYDEWKRSGAPSISDMQVQLNVLSMELNGSSTGDVLNNPTNSADYMAWYFCYHFERPANKDERCRQRQEAANNILSYVQNGCS